MKDKCYICKKILTHKWKSPYSICYDSQWIGNVCGGDSHEYICYICKRCGNKIRKGLRMKAEESSALKAPEWTSIDAIVQATVKRIMEIIDECGRSANCTEDSIKLYPIEWIKEKIKEEFK